MKKILFSLLLLFTAASAQAQAALIGLFVNGTTLAVRAAKANRAKTAGLAATTDDKTVAVATYRGQPCPMKRTPAAQLPRKGGEEIAQLETLLQRCQAAMTADSTARLWTSDQQLAFQTAQTGVLKRQSGWNIQPYQDEAKFYVAEDARRQRAAAPTK